MHYFPFCEWFAVFRSKYVNKVLVGLSCSCKRGTAVINLILQGPVSSCNIYAVQQDIQSVFLMSEFIQHLCQLDMFRTSSVHHQERFLQAVFADLVGGNTRTTRHVQLDVSSSTHGITTYQSLRIQLVKDAPDVGPVRSETCRANISAE